MSLVTVHALMIAHVVHWLIRGETLSPIEPSEAMYTLNDGELNAGFIFFAVALLATLSLGRFVCGWGCHLVAYQDLCAWLLKRAGIKPKAFRARFLVFAPFALAVYMFVWPSVQRAWMGGARPALSNHLMTTTYWATFPGLVVAILSVVVCGFMIVYFLGSKGFCTYACPYGGFFRVLDQVAVGRILVTDACQHCGHCTAVCTSNVRIHEEVAKYGMVVDPGCMKCMDCVSVCPNDALHFGLAKPPVAAQVQRIASASRFDFSVGEELIAIVVGVVTLLTCRGLYGRIPLLLAMAFAAMTAYAAIKSLRLIRDSNVRFQNLQLKRGGRLTRSGALAVVVAVSTFALLGHSATVQSSVWRGHRALAKLSISDDVWYANSTWWQHSSAERKREVDEAVAQLERADRWGLMTTPDVLGDLVWLYLARDECDRAENALHRLIEIAPEFPDAYRGLAGVRRRQGDIDEARRWYDKALSLDASFAPARRELAAMLIEQNRFDDAIAVYRSGIDIRPGETEWPMLLGKFLTDIGRPEDALVELTALVNQHPDYAPGYAQLGTTALQAGRVDEGIAALRQAANLNPDLHAVHYHLGMAMLELRRIDEAIEHLEHAVAVDASFALAHYNLGVAVFMAGRPADAVPHIRKAIDLNSDDPDAHGFLSVVLGELGDTKGSQQAAQKERQLRVEISDQSSRPMDGVRP